MDDVILKTMEETLVERLNELVAADERVRKEAALLPHRRSSLPEAAAIIAARRIIRAEQEGIRFGINVIRSTRRVLYAQSKAS